MPYGVDTTAFRALDEEVRRLPERMPTDPRQLEGLLFRYLKAVSALLSLMLAILNVCVERQDRRRYVQHFLPIFEHAAARLRELLEAEIREGLEARSQNLVELGHAIRDSYTSAELVALETALAESERTASPEEHADTTTTVTNSLKQQIEKYTKRSWIKSVLHALNEVISIVRGVV